VSLCASIFRAVRVSPVECVSASHSSPSTAVKITSVAAAHGDLAA
jgi:hypothetical protein